jgi:hypothetical protein
MPVIPLIAVAVLLVVGLNLLAVALCRAAALGDAVVDRGRNRPAASDLDTGPARSGPRPRDRARERA